MNLAVRNLTLRNGNKMICDGLNLTINPHEIWGILGSNGSGKTTLLHALAGITPTQSGEIYLQGKNLANLSLKKIAQQLGILFQDFHPTFPQTVWDYCLAARFPHRDYFHSMSLAELALVNTTLNFVELRDYTHRLITDLSGGEKKRLALASLFIQTPQVYLLDEPTNDLDVHHQMKILQHLTLLAETQAASIVMSLHDVNLAQQFCQRILMLFDDGEMMMGNKLDVLTQENLSRLYKHPMRMMEMGKEIFWQPAINDKNAFHML